MQNQIARLTARLRVVARRLYALYRRGLWSRGLPPGLTIELVVGWPLLLLPAVVFSQIVTPHPVWVVLLVTLAVLYVTGYWWVRHQTPAIRFDRRRQGSVLVAGDVLREDFVLRNASGLPVLWAEFEDASTLPGYAPGSVVAAPAGGEYRWWKEAQCAQRGVFRLGPHRLRLGDPFGLFVSHVRFERAETVLIYPRVVQLPQVELPRGSAGGAAARRRPLLGVLPAASVREYVQGDSMRHIHWPSTAHRAHFMVKELELEPSGDVWIVLNLEAAVHRGEGSSGTLEYAIILAASMAAEMVTGRERRAVGLLTASGEEVVALPPQPGQAHLWSIMAALAPAQPTAWPLEELLRRNLPALGRRHTLIVVTPGVPPAVPGAQAGPGAQAEAGGWLPALVQAQRLGLGGSVLLVTLPADEPVCRAVQRQLAGLEIPTQVLRTDMPLRAAITYRRTRKVIRTTPTGGAYTVEIEEGGRVSERDLLLEGAPPEERQEWPLRLWFWVARTWRPVLGWSVLALCMALTMLPALLLGENLWLRTPALLNRLYGLGPLAIAVGWLLAGWRRPWGWRPGWLRRTVQVGAFLLAGLVAVSQLLGEWLPGLGAWGQAVRTGAWEQLGGEAGAALAQLAGRFGLWWQGVQANSAARDDLVLAGVVAVTLWLLAGLVVVLARRNRSGLAAALPILWPMGLVMLYSPADRLVFVVAVALTLVLHLLLEQQALMRRWQAKKLDYNASLLMEKGLLALAWFMLALVLASVMPNLYVYDVTARYYAWLQPVNDQLEAASKRLFPGLTGASAPWLGRGVAGGLPNAFLLGAGSEPGQREVMRVRTDELVYAYDQPPAGHPLRGATFADYDGRGWTNRDRQLLTTQFEANQPWAELTRDRRPLLQSVNLSFAASAIYAAGEPATPSIAYVAKEHFPGDLVALAARTRSYTVVSQLPALDRAQLEALPAWGEANPLPAEYGIYLSLPVSVTQRTRDLAAQLTGVAPTGDTVTGEALAGEALAGEALSMYGKAAAIEAYLRTLPYDLAVTLPDAGVADVADYFLFELRRGYCDYYATAFVVLARAVGLPARFVTGFAPGSWSVSDRQWIVTEAEAHSWPEVYFPEVGWVRFEPTAYRPLPVRVGLPAAGVVGVGGEPFEPLAQPASISPWLLVWWVVLAAGPVLLVGWGVWRWRRGREDPWLGLLRWGQRMGRPLAAGDTALEYGAALAERAVAGGRGDETQRSAAREVRALSEDVSVVQYGAPGVRDGARVRVQERWGRLRGLLRRLRG